MQVEAAEPGWWLEHVVGGDDFWQLESTIKLDEVLKNQSPQYDVLIIDEGQDFHLPHNCRNTIRIIELLEQYIDKKIPYREETPAGEPVRFYSYKNDIEQVRMVKEEWLRLVQQEQISPGRIVIIMSTHWEQSCLSNTKAFGQWPIESISKESGYISPGHVNITTIRTFKGLEANLRFSKTEREQKPIKANTPQP